MNLTNHAKKRSQQRGISNDVMELIYFYGLINKKNTVSFYQIPKNEIDEKISYHNYMAKTWERAKNKTIVVSDDKAIITTYCNKNM